MFSCQNIPKCLKAWCEQCDDTRTAQGAHLIISCIFQEFPEHPPSGKLLPVLQEENDTLVWMPFLSFVQAGWILRS